ncbi:MAG: glycosyl hydrolase 2 galactose-binding domain-containing protein, partial [Bacteroidales bacterium]
MSSILKIVRRLSGTMLPVLFLVICSCHPSGEEFTRGIGIYPGDPDEDFSPILKHDTSSYRNLARLRPAWHSSSYDYNLTAQLVTDGIITGEMPAILLEETNEGPVPKNEREWVLDHVTGSGISINGNEVWLQLGLEGWDPLPEVTSIVLNGSVIYDAEKQEGYRFLVSGSMDGVAWEELDRSTGTGLPGFTRSDAFGRRQRNESDTTRPRFDFFADFMGPRDPDEPSPSFSFSFGDRPPRRNLAETFSWEYPLTYRYYRVSLQAPAGVTWTIGDLDFYSGDEQIEMSPSHRFRSAWMSAGEGEEWISVDLGTVSTFDRVVLHWIRQSGGGTIQVSDDGMEWKDMADVPEAPAGREEVALDGGASGRYVRLLVKGNGAQGRAILSEMEVMGRGGLVPVPKPAPSATAIKMPLTGGSWRIQRASLVEDNGIAVSSQAFDCSGWVVATVPGTALVSYLNAGALPDPNYADNQLMISESYFNADFWYRNEFEVPENFNGERVFLHFDGINWKAEIFLNGNTLGMIEGAFIRGNFDITDQLRKGASNVLAVKIIKNAHFGCVKEQTALSPDKNGGILGADNPTYHASVGWDWIPTIRGRNIGIWNDVYLTATGSVTLEDPFIYSDLQLPDTTTADLHLEVALNNHSDKPVSGVLSG